MVQNLRNNVLLTKLLLVLVLLFIASACRSGSDETSHSATANPTHQLVLRAQEDMKEGRYMDALAMTDSVLSTSRANADAWFLRGRIYFELGEMEKAEEAYTTASDIEPDYRGLWHNLGNVSFESGRYREAITRYQREIEQHPAANPWHGLGGTYESLGEADSARMAYERALQEDPAYAQAHLALSDWYERGGDFEAALDHIQKAVSLNPASLEYRYKLGNILVRSGRYEQGVEELKQVYAEEPWNFSALFSLGQGLQRLGRTEEAEQVLSRANEIREQQSVVNRLGRRAKNEPTNFSHQVAYAEALRQTGRLAEAIEVYQVAQSLRPDNLALRNNIATLFLQSGHEDEAVMRYLEILEKDSTYGEAWINLAVYYSRKKDEVQARQAWENALRYAPDHPLLQSLRENGKP